MTADLVGFLCARPDEDEQVAADANTSPEMVTGIPRSYADAPVAIHIGRWDPARVLAEVDTKRRIVAECLHMIQRGEPERSGAEWFLRLLAVPSADHPDYRPEWAPEA